MCNSVNHLGDGSSGEFLLSGAVKAEGKLREPTEARLAGETGSLKPHHDTFYSRVEAVVSGADSCGSKSVARNIGVADRSSCPRPSQEVLGLSSIGPARGGDLQTRTPKRRYSPIDLTPEQLRTFRRETQELYIQMCNTMGFIAPACGAPQPAVPDSELVPTVEDFADEPLTRQCFPRGTRGVKQFETYQFKCSVLGVRAANLHYLAAATERDMLVQKEMANFFATVDDEFVERWMRKEYRSLTDLHALLLSYESKTSQYAMEIAKIRMLMHVYTREHSRPDITPQGPVDWITGKVASATREAGVNLGSGVAAGLREELRATLISLVSDTSSFDWMLDRFVDYSTVLSAAYMSEQTSVRILLAINLVSKLVHDLGLTSCLKSTLKLFYHQFVKHARAEGELSEETHQVLLEHLDAAGLQEVREFTPQAPMSRLQTMLSVQVIMLVIREILSFLKSQLSKWFTKESWRLMRDDLRDNHTNLYMLLEGSRLIRDKGGAGWVHASPRNAMLAARVLYYANLVQTQYETEPCPIDKRYLKDVIMSARTNALLSNTLVNGKRPGAVICYLIGPTRQGKTVATQLITARLNERLGVEPTVSYSFPLSSDFKDGYCCQPVCLFTDAFMAADATTRYKETEFLMRAHDTDAFPLDQAVAEKKGTVFFQSSYLLCSSNIDVRAGDAQQFGLAQKDPLLSRLDFFGELTCIDRNIMVQTQTIDPRTGEGSWVIDDTLAAERYPDGVSEDIYAIDLFNAMTGVRLGRVTLPELVNRLDMIRDQRFRRFAGATATTDWSECDRQIRDYGLGLDVPPELEHHVPVDPEHDNVQPEALFTWEGEGATWGEQMVASYWNLVAQAVGVTMELIRYPKWAFMKTARFFAEDIRQMNYQWSRRHGTAATHLAELQQRVGDFVRRAQFLQGCWTVIISASCFIATRYAARKFNDYVERKWNKDAEEPPPGLTLQQESYDNKISKCKVVKFAPRVVYQHEALVESRVEQVESFLQSEFPIDPVVEAKHSMMIEVPEVDHTVRGYTAQPFVRQGCDDITALQAVGHALTTQLYWGAVSDGERNLVSYGQFFNICGLYYTCPLHVGKKIANASIVELFGANNHCIEARLFTVVKELPQSELMILRLPDNHGFPYGKNLVSKLVDIADLTKMSKNVLSCVRLFNNMHTAAFFGSSNAEVVSSGVLTDINVSCDYRLVSAIRYPLMQTFRGMCGAPIVALGGELTGRIFAFHCAGEASACGGMGSPILRKDFEFLQPPPVAPPPITLEDDPEVVPPVPISWGKIDEKLYQRQSTTTNLRPSRVYGWRGPSPCKQAHLGCVGDKNPMAIGQAKWFGMNYALDSANVDRCCEYMANSIQAEFSKTGEPECRKLSVVEAIQGVAGEIPSMNLLTSPGFPFNRLLGGNKTAWISRDEETHEVVAIHPFLDECVQRMDAQVSDGIVPFVVFRDSLKDETRPIAKVDAGKTRVFSGAPLDYTIVFRMYTADFVNKLVRFCVSLPIKIGLDVHGRDWGNLHTRFDRIPGDNWLNGDCANFDGTESALHVARIVAVVFVAFHKQHEKQLNALGLPLAVAIHIFEAWIYQVTHGVPSGTPATSLVNSMVLWLVHLLFWVHCGYPLAEYMVRTESGFYGDDSLIKVDPQYPMFNMVGMAAYMKTIGMEYTMADKSSTIVPYVKERDVTFLKRSFVYDANLAVWKAPLPMDVIDDIPNWQRGSDLAEREQLTSTFEAYCLEMSHYDEPTYWANTQELARAMARVGVVVSPPLYDQLMQRYQDG